MHVGGDTAPWEGLLVRGGGPYRMLGSALLEECPQACSAEHVVGRMAKVVGEGTDSGEPTRLGLGLRAKLQMAGAGRGHRQRRGRSQVVKLQV